MEKSGKRDSDGKLIPIGAGSLPLLLPIGRIVVSSSKDPGMLFCEALEFDRDRPVRGAMMNQQQLAEEG